jgi:aerobic carbon-monoxide dehydrogenase medium subunit
MYPAHFNYHRPKTLAEATRLLQANKDAKLLAGGHSLIPAMKLRVAGPGTLVDIGAIPELSGITSDDAVLRIGSATTHGAIEASDEVRAHCPVLADAAAQIGDIQVRNRGTIGGALAHADPAADFPTVVVALRATLVAAGSTGTREMPAEGFFKDLFTTDLASTEVLAAVLVPTYGKGTGGAYLKHRHPASSYAVVGVAALVTIVGGKYTKASVVVGGATVNPVRARAAEEALVGHAAADEAIATAAAKVAMAITDPLSDYYASGEFRIHLATVMARRALAQASTRAKG